MQRVSTKPGWAVPFFTIWTGQALSLLGSRIAGFALVWWLTTTTGSAVVLTISSLMFFLPQIVLGPFAGALTDRWNRRWVMGVADATSAVASTVLALLFWSDQMQVWHIYVTTFITSLSGAFHFAAMSASTSLMAPPEQLTRIQGANQILQGLLGIAAPPVGALLVGVLPFAAIMGIDVVTALFAIIPLLFITIPQPQRTEAPTAITPKMLWRDVQGGLQYIWAWSGLRTLVLFALLINFMGNPLGALMPLLVTQHYGGGALQLGWLELAFGLGVLAGGILLSVWGGFKRRTLLLPPGLIGIGIGALLIGFSPATAFWLGLTGMSIFGIMSSTVNGLLMAILQGVVAPAMQGRVFTALNSGAQLAVPFGLLLAGPIADAFGPQLWFILAGVGTVLCGISTYFVPTLLNLEEEKQASVIELTQSMSIAGQL